jgi:hypothetical protein
VAAGLSRTRAIFAEYYCRNNDSHDFEDSPGQPCLGILTMMEHLHAWTIEILEEAAKHQVRYKTIDCSGHTFTDVTLDRPRMG